jgi:pimeloyl-ACP methyl ester carboxylesterase
MSHSVILLHGALGAGEQMRSLANTLEASGFQVFAFDFSGHGTCPFKEAGFSIKIFAQELHTFIEVNKLERPSIFGYSMGGYVALYLAAQYPNLIGKIATLATKYCWDIETSTKEAKQLDPDKLLEKVPKYAAVLQNRHIADWKLLLNKTAQLMLDLGNNPLLHHSVLQGIDIPVLIGVGDRDSMTSVNETLQLYQSLPQGQMYMLPDTKHPIETVKLNLLSNILVHFFN